MLDLAHIESFFPPQLRPFKKNLVREYLHYKILEQIFRSPQATSLSFMGGTAIHILHGNTRFSEDLDFDNRGIDEKGFRELGSRLVRELSLQGYDVDSKIVIKSAYHIHLRFARLLHDIGISPHADEVMTIQIDAEPQNYIYTQDIPLINKFDVFTRVGAVPANVLLSQKITCLFTRKRPMGRDVFDIVFLKGKTAPDLGYLREKLGTKTSGELKKKLLDWCKENDLKRLARDVEPFLFSAQDTKKVVDFADLVTTAF
jgi:predicted nucleotidyltransferase component of viral defense system